MAAEPDIARKHARFARSLAKPKKHPPNMASARYIRKCRVRFNGHLSWLIEREAIRLAFSTLIPAGWLVPADKLSEVEPRKLLEQLRGVLNRAGIDHTDGWMAAVLDLEYIEHLGCWSIHVHMISTGGATRVIRSLRAKPKFRRCADHPEIGRRPVQVKAVARGTEARVVNYLVKIFFGMQVYLEKNGVLERQQRRIAVPARRQAELLAWLKQWKIDDFVLTVGLYFGKDRLLVSKNRKRVRRHR